MYHSITIDDCIKDFLATYRSMFPTASIIVKMHLLEDHVVPWLQQFNLGAGLMGEQGAESLHSHMHNLENTYKTIPNATARLEYMFHMYNLETCPALQDLKPPVKKEEKAWGRLQWLT